MLQMRYTSAVYTVLQSVQSPRTPPASSSPYTGSVVPYGEALVWTMDGPLCSCTIRRPPTVQSPRVDVRFDEGCPSATDGPVNATEGGVGVPTG